ncbi:MAG: ArsR/SmtB family transcription factor [Flavobacteriia bacterium]|jgi:ArsR family transcriptional regulator
MGITKSAYFSDAQNDLANVFKALGHPARIAIVEFLLKQESCICGDIVNELPLSQPTISQHLKELKNAQIIKGSIEGNTICYCINTETITKISESIGLFKINKNGNSCCE